MTAQDSDNLSSQLELPHLPDMLFSNNKVELKHEGGAVMQFIPMEALKLVNAPEDLVHVAVAADWLAARQDSPHLNKIVHPYDWTFTTEYKGGPRFLPTPCYLVLCLHSRDVDSLQVRAYGVDN